MNEFWQKIKQDRKQSEKTLKEISEKTKINITYLENIENGDFSSIDPTYMRLFIRAYANEIGADYKELIKNTPLFKKEDKKITKNVIDSKNKKSEKKKLNISVNDHSNKLLKTIVIIILIIFIIVVINRIANKNKKIPQEAKKVTKEIVVEEPSNQKTDENENKTNDIKKNSLNETINVFQFPIHLEIFPDNNLVYRLDIKNKPPKEELILKNKNHYLTIDSPFHLTIYNASQCLLKINKKIIPIKPNIDNFEFSISDSGNFVIE